MFEGVSNADDLIAAFQKYRIMRGNNGGGTGGFKHRRDTRPARQDTATRPPRKCANCGESHEARVCPNPAVAVEDRKCWTCGLKHMSRDCPQKGKVMGRPVNAIEDGPIAAIDRSDLSAFLGRSVAPIRSPPMG